MSSLRGTREKKKRKKKRGQDKTDRGLLPVRFPLLPGGFPDCWRIPVPCFFSAGLAAKQSVVYQLWWSQGLGGKKAGETARYGEGDRTLEMTQPAVSFRQAGKLVCMYPEETTRSVALFGLGLLASRRNTRWRGGRGLGRETTTQASSAQ